MTRDLELQADGRWLLREGGRVFVVPDALGRRLADGTADPELDAALAVRCGGAAPARTLWLRCGLLPAGVVRRLAGTLSGLASWPSLALLVGVGTAGYFAAPSAPIPAPGPATAFGALGLALAAAFLHEIGHAAALTRAGGRPGGVGAGLLFILPVLYCDVTAVALLPRRERLRVDAAGLAWHLAAGGVLAACGGAACSLAAWGVLAAAVWNLLPFLRTDGYWLLADALDVPSLAPFRLWRCAHLVFLALLGAGLVWRAIRLLDWASGRSPSTLLRVVIVAVAGVCLAGLARRARGLL